MAANNVPVVWLCGPPASGKSTFGKPLAQRLGAIFIDLDTATNPLLELIMRLMGTNDIDDPALIEVVREPRYEIIHAIALENAGNGTASVVVAPFTSERRDRSHFDRLVARYGDAGASPVLVWLDTPAHVINERMRRRGADRDHGKLATGAPTDVMDLTPPVVPHIVVQWPITESTLDEVVGTIRSGPDPHLQ